MKRKLELLLLTFLFITNVSFGQVTIDLLVAYTSAANSYSGGSQQTIAIIEQAVDDANASFVNSGINIQYNLVRIGYLSYTEGGKTAEQIWTDFSTNSTIADLRNEYNADLCFLAFGSSSATGYGEFPPNDDPSPSTSHLGFAVANIYGVEEYYSLAHELGHNFGAHHDYQLIHSIIIIMDILLQMVRGVQ